MAYANFTYAALKQKLGLDPPETVSLFPTITPVEPNERKEKELTRAIKSKRKNPCFPSNVFIIVFKKNVCVTSVNK